jgi:hypothetical protein
MMINGSKTLFEKMPARRRLLVSGSLATVCLISGFSTTTETNPVARCLLFLGAIVGHLFIAGSVAMLIRGRRLLAAWPITLATLIAGFVYLRNWLTMPISWTYSSNTVFCALAISLMMDFHNALMELKQPQTLPETELQS